MINTLIGKVFGTKNERVIKTMMPKVEAINALEPQMRQLSDEELRAKSDGFRRRIQERMSRAENSPTGGAEAGVWVIAETHDLPSVFRRIVVTDDRGRFLLRDNEKNQVVAERLLRPAFCLRAGERFDADAPILPVAVAA